MKILLDRLEVSQKYLERMISNVEQGWKIICVGGNKKEICYSKVPYYFKYCAEEIAPDKENFPMKMK